MKTVIVLLSLLASTSFASFTSNATTEIRASDYSCADIGQAIRSYGKLFVRTGLFGVSFRYPPNECNIGDRKESVLLKVKNGESCRLYNGCFRDPNYPRH